MRALATEGSQPSACVKPRGLALFTGASMVEVFEPL